MRYFITFSCYGSHVPGDACGSVDSHHNRYNGPLAEPSLNRTEAGRRAMRQKPYLLDAMTRAAVLNAAKLVCGHRAWNLLAAHIRTNHAHFVIEAPARPEKVLNDLKSYATRRINQGMPRATPRHHWSRHGSTRYLWTDQQVRNAIRYVVHEQGPPMAVYENEAWI